MYVFSFPSCESDIPHQLITNSYQIYLPNSSVTDPFSIYFLYLQCTILDAGVEVAMKRKKRIFLKLYSFIVIIFNSSVFNT